MDVAIGAAASGVSATMPVHVRQPGPAPYPTTAATSPSMPGPASVLATTVPSGPSTAPVQYATELPDSMFAALMAKANLSVMIKAVQAYRSAMKELDESAG